MTQIFEHYLFFILSLFAILFFSILSNFIDDGEVVVKQITFFFALFVSLILTIFPSPSEVVFHMAKSEQVFFARELFHKYGIKDERTLLAICNNLVVFESKILKKLYVLRSGIILLWAYFVYEFSKYIETGINLDIHSLLTWTKNNFLFVFIFIVFFILIESYKTYISIIFRALEIGANEFKYNLYQNI